MDSYEILNQYLHYKEGDEQDVGALKEEIDDKLSLTITDDYKKGGLEDE